MSIDENIEEAETNEINEIIKKQYQVDGVSHGICPDCIEEYHPEIAHEFEGKYKNKEVMDKQQFENFLKNDGVTSLKEDNLVTICQHCKSMEVSDQNEEKSKEKQKQSNYVRPGIYLNTDVTKYN